MSDYTWPDGFRKLVKTHEAQKAELTAEVARLTARLAEMEDAIRDDGMYSVPKQALLEAEATIERMTPVVQDVEYLWRFRHDDIAHLPEELEDQDEQDIVDRLMDTFMAYQRAVEKARE